MRLLPALVLALLIFSGGVAGSRAEDSVQEAIAILESVGAAGVCHPLTNDFAPALPLCHHDITLHRRLESTHNEESWFFARNALFSLLCVIASAIMAGTLMGFMTLDPLMLSIKARAANSPEDRHKAQALLPFTQRKNLVLVSILVVNCATNEALPIFLNEIVPDYVAVILSVTLVVIAGEIIPSAYFMGKDQINVAFRLIPLARFIILLTSPISYPFAKLLDSYFLEGEEKSAFKRGEVSALVRIQYEERMAWKRRNQMKNQSDLSPLESYAADGKDQPLLSRCGDIMEPLEFLAPDREQCFPIQCMGQGDLQECESIDNDDLIKVEGALTLKNKTVAQSFTRMHSVFAIPSDTILDEGKVVEIYNKGYSRVPVYDRHPLSNHGDDTITNIRGILLTRQLLVIDKTTKRSVSTLPLYRPPCLSPDTSMADAMNAFQAHSKKGSHMAIVCIWPEVATAALDRNEPIPIASGVVGIITLENVIEELIQEQIHDEKDRKEKGPLERARWAIAKWKAFVLKKHSDREDEGIAKTQVVGILV